MTIYEIKRLTSTTSPYFFDRPTLRFFGQRMRDFRVKKCADGRYRINARMRMGHGGRIIGETIRYFNPANNELEEEEETK